LAAASNFKIGFNPIAAKRLLIVRNQRLERRIVLPFRVLRRGSLHLIEHEGQLKIQRLLGPERAVVVEDCDAVFRRDEVQVRPRGHFAHELDDRLLRGAGVP
jgi:hypothetical protein